MAFRRSELSELSSGLPVGRDRQAKSKISQYFVQLKTVFFETAIKMKNYKS